MEHLIELPVEQAQKDDEDHLRLLQMLDSDGDESDFPGAPMNSEKVSARQIPVTPEQSEFYKRQ